MESENCYKFLKKRHVAFLRRCLSVLPPSAVCYDTSRMTVLFFAVSGLDILGALEEVPKKEREEIIEWIYTLQLTSSDGHKYGGFRGGHCISNIFGSTPSILEGLKDVQAVPNTKSTSLKDCNGQSTNGNEKDHLLDIRLSEGQVPAKILRHFGPARHEDSPTVKTSPTDTEPSNDSTKDSSLPSENYDESRKTHFERSLDSAHIAMTYSALATLVVLGDDLKRVDKPAVLRHVASLQCSDGSFFSNCGGSENDLRFVYCAAVVCYLLGDTRAINTSAAIRYIRECLGYAGALGQGAYQESHGGSTYCGVAALHLLGALQRLNLLNEEQDKKNTGRQPVPWFNESCREARRARRVAQLAFRRKRTPENEITFKKAKAKCRYIIKRARANSSNSLSVEELHGLVRWLLMRQENAAGRVATGEVNELAGGLQGRPNKPADTCYTFWVGAALKMLGCADMLDAARLQQFVLSTQDPLTGGMAKYSNGQPDGIHTFLGLSGLSVLGLVEELNDVDPALNITQRAKRHWKSLKMEER